MPTAPTISAASALSDHFDTRTAATEVADRLADGLDGTCDLAVVFASFHHRAAFPEALETIRGTIAPETLIGCTTDSVLGVGRELEGRAGLVALGMQMPGATVHGFRHPPAADEAAIDITDDAALRNFVGVNEATRAVILLADPFSTPMSQFLPRLMECRGADAPVPVAGAMASGASQPGHNALALNGDLATGGLVGVSIGGDVDVDFTVSQGCRPIGEPVVITKAKENLILELGGRKAMELAQEIASELSDEERQLLGRGLFVGVVINEYKKRFGRDDFLIRNIVGSDQRVGGIAVADHVRVGQTVQFHVRDAATAAEDMELLLDAQNVRGGAKAAMLFTCNGRGSNLFEEEHHDAQALERAFGPIPVAGFFAAGEIGPIGDRSFLHGHTASLVLFR